MEVAANFGARAGLGCLLLLAVVARAGEHPVPLEKGFEPAQCVSCHEDKATGKAVHSAIAMGCTACHEVQTGEPTTIDLVAPKQELCLTCHTASEEPVKHPPYGQGLCSFCHDPHTAGFTNNLRAATNDLCLTCHAQDAKGETGPDAQTLLFFGGAARLPGHYLDGVRRIRVLRAAKGHPTGQHPFAGVADPSLPERRLSCVSCHLPHAGAAKGLFVTGTKSSSPLCIRCHK